MDSVILSRIQMFSFRLRITGKKNTSPEQRHLLSKVQFSLCDLGTHPPASGRGQVTPACAGAARGQPPLPGGPCVSLGRWPASHNAGASGQRLPPPATARCGDGWPCSGRCQSGTVPETAPRAPTLGPASGPAG